MLSWAMSFVAVAIIAGVLEFGGIAGVGVGIAKILFILFLNMCVLLTAGRKRPAV